MTRNELKLIFRAFKEAGIYANFLQDVDREALRRGRSLKKHITGIQNFGNFVDIAMVWFNSKLGDDFWSEMDDVFRYKQYDANEFIKSVFCVTEHFETINKKKKKLILGNYV